MDKYVYCHDSGKYEAYSGLDGKERKIFDNLQRSVEAGVFLYAPTTRGKAILFSYTMSGGQSRADGYKGEFEEMGDNPAAYYGQLRAEKPYDGKVSGALPADRSCDPSNIDPDVMASLAENVIFGDPSKDIVLICDDTATRIEYLKFLYLLLAPEYAHRLGVCVNKYIKFALDNTDKFGSGDEKPIIRIYAPNGKRSYSDSCVINADTREYPAPSEKPGPAALRRLIGSGVSVGDFADICDATAPAFCADGKVNAAKYTECVVRKAYEITRDIKYAAAILGYGFDSEKNRALFIDGIKDCLSSDDKNAQSAAADAAIKFLGDDISAVKELLIEYIVSKSDLTAKERGLLVGLAVSEADKDGNITDWQSGVLGSYIVSPTPSWSAKFAFAADVLSKLVDGKETAAAHGMCKIIAQRFNENSLADEDPSAFFATLRNNYSGAVARMGFAALLYGDTTGDMPTCRYAKTYMSKSDTLNLAQILAVRNEMEAIFGNGEDCDFIFSNSDCAGRLKGAFDKIPFDAVIDKYNELEDKIGDYDKFGAELFLRIYDVDKLKGKISDGEFINKYNAFLENFDPESVNDSTRLNTATKNKLIQAYNACRSLVGENKREIEVKSEMEKFCNDFALELYGTLDDASKEDIDGKKKKRSRKSEESDQAPRTVEYGKVIGKFGASNSVGLHFNGKEAMGYGVLLCLLAGLITMLIMFVPAFCTAAAVGEVTFASVSLHMSRYFYAAVSAPVLAMLCYAVLYLFVYRRRGSSAFAVTALTVFVPCVMCGLGYVLSFIVLT